TLDFEQDISGFVTQQGQAGQQLKQEMIQAKQELVNLAQTQRVAHHIYEPLEENLKSITGIQELVNSTVRNSNEEPSNLQDLSTRLQLLEDTVKKDLGMEELRRRLDGVAGTAENLISERNINALKTNLKSQAEDQRKLDKKVKSQYQDAKGYMQDTLAEVSKIDLRLKDLERTNPPFKGVNNHTEVHDNQDDTVPGDEVVISAATVM
ncbi:MAG: hypothetical protein Q9205_003841, partial [Flavoplaca limonia]